MFYAVIRDKHLIFNKDANLVFETVIVNEGEHYDPYDGVFVAPQKGVYLFSWTVSGINKEYIVTELETNSYQYFNIYFNCKLQLHRFRQA
jgi:hypothetical protein